MKPSQIITAVAGAFVLSLLAGAARGADAPLPAKLKLTQTVQAQYFINGESKGTMQARAGLEFHPDGIEGDKVFVSLAKGERLYAPLSATNYKEALASDQEKTQADAAAKEPLRKDAVSLDVKIGRLVPAGISSQERKDPAGQVIKANTFVASVPAAGLNEGDWWKGGAFPIGQVTHPNTGETFDCYTANLDEYFAFKIGRRDTLAAYTDLARKQGIKPKLDYGEFAALASSLELDRALRMSAGLTVNQPDETTTRGDWGFEISNEQILRLKAKESRIEWLKEVQPLWIKASELAGFWLKNREMSAPAQQWLKLLQEATLKFNSNEVSGFRQAVQRLHNDWAGIQAACGQ